MPLTRLVTGTSYIQLDTFAKKHNWQDRKTTSKAKLAFWDDYEPRFSQKSTNLASKTSSGSLASICSELLRGDFNKKFRAARMSPRRTINPKSHAMKLKVVSLTIIYQWSAQSHPLRKLGAKRRDLVDNKSWVWDRSWLGHPKRVDEDWQKWSTAGVKWCFVDLWKLMHLDVQSIMSHLPVHHCCHSSSTRLGCSNQSLPQIHNLLSTKYLVLALSPL